MLGVPGVPGLHGHAVCRHRQALHTQLGGFQQPLAGGALRNTFFIQRQRLREWQLSTFQPVDDGYEACHERLVAGFLLVPLLYHTSLAS